MGEAHKVKSAMKTFSSKQKIQACQRDQCSASCSSGAAANIKGYQVSLEKTLIGTRVLGTRKLAESREGGIEQKVLVYLVGTKKPRESRQGRHYWDTRKLGEKKQTEFKLKKNSLWEEVLLSISTETPGCMYLCWNIIWSGNFSEAGCRITCRIQHPIAIYFA